jgi:hypothetical protein
LECGFEGGGVEDVGGLPVGLVGGFVWRVGGKVEDFVAAGEEAVDNMCADESGTAGDEDFHKMGFRKLERENILSFSRMLE